MPTPRPDTATIPPLPDYRRPGDLRPGDRRPDDGPPDDGRPDDRRHDSGERASARLRRLGPDFRQPGSAPRWRLGAGAGVVAVLVLLAIGIALSAASSARGSSALQEVRPPSSGPSGRLSGAPTPSPTSAPTASATVFVHIVGRVASPGLYEVPAGSRAVTVVEAAGGFAESADQGALNLARPVVDGEQIVVTAVGEAPPAPAPGSPAAAGTGAHAVSGPVDLNAADAAALETLRGVGPATAEAILAWRDEHGRFESVDDLLDVPGIGEKKLDALRDAVAVR